MNNRCAQIVERKFIIKITKKLIAKQFQLIAFPIRDEFVNITCGRQLHTNSASSASYVTTKHTKIIFWFQGGIHVNGQCLVHQCCKHVPCVKETTLWTVIARTKANCMGESNFGVGAAKNNRFVFFITVISRETHPGHGSAVLLNDPKVMETRTIN